MRFLSVLLTIILIGTTGLGIAQAQRKTRKPIRKSSAAKQQPQPVKNNPMANDFKVLVEDDQSGMEEPFIFVARTPQQYAELKTFAQNLPTAETIDLTLNAVVAVFAGQKSTAGYGVNFEKTANVITDKIATSVKVTLTSPAKGAMLAQVLTAPMKIVLIPLEEDKGISVIPDANWRQRMQTFRVSQSTFEASGGFTGRSRKFNISGSIDVLRTGNLITAFFNVGTGESEVQGIFETATGRIENNSVVLPRLDAGNLVENPRPPLSATGKLTGKDLSLTFKSLPTNVSDGFMGQGSLTATLIK